MTNEQHILQLNNRITVLESLILKNTKKGISEMEKLKLLYVNARIVFNNYFGVDINKKVRTRYTITARQMYYRYLKDNTCLSHYQIGKTLDIAQDHSTVTHALGEFNDKMETEAKYREDWMKINKILLKGKQ